ncbi:MAG TPA: hypothetical protein VN442_18045 [Bryobacteraceae bacterium]|nr:hypothetical protein [Bryobacteraceae bacterium]
MPLARLPGDPLFTNQRSFQDLNITRAWGLTTGSRAVIVAVLDQGFFYQHEDIRDNSGGIPGNRVRMPKAAPRKLTGWMMINWDVSLMLLKIGAEGIRRNETDAEQKLTAGNNAIEMSRSGTSRIPRRRQSLVHRGL